MRRLYALAAVALVVYLWLGLIDFIDPKERQWPK